MNTVNPVWSAKLVFGHMKLPSVYSSNFRFKSAYNYLEWSKLYITINYCIASNANILVVIANNTPNIIHALQYYALLVVFFRKFKT